MIIQGTWETRIEGGGGIKKTRDQIYNKEAEGLSGGVGGGGEGGGGGRDWWGGGRGKIVRKGSASPFQSSPECLFHHSSL